LLCHCSPKRARPFTSAAIGCDVYITSFDDEAAEFDEMPHAFAAFDLPDARVMSRSCGLLPVARRSLAQEGR
jgi:hypothetical protein